MSRILVTASAAGKTTPDLRVSQVYNCVFYACRWLSISPGLQQLKVGGRPKDGAEMEKCCIDCRFFQDAHYSRTYIVPICIAHGGDDAAFMRKYICGLDQPKLFEPKLSSLPPITDGSPA